MSPSTYLIGIAGPSGSGKSFLATRLARQLQGHVLGTDAYYRDLGHLPPHDRAHSNFDDPAAIDHLLLIEQVSRLRHGEPVDVPLYDFATHTRKPETRTFEASGVVIVEGLFTLYWPELRALFGTKVYVDLHDELCLKRRTHRDVRERGRTPDSVLQQYNTTVAPMAEHYVRPTIAHADVVVFGADPIAEEIARVLEHYRSQRPEDLEPHITVRAQP